MVLETAGFSIPTYLPSNRCSGNLSLLEKVKKGTEVTSPARGYSRFEVNHMSSLKPGYCNNAREVGNESNKIRGWILEISPIILLFETYN